jgi:hypothetical protein
MLAFFLFLRILFDTVRRIALFLGAAALTALVWAQGSPLSKSESLAQNGFRTAIFINVIGSGHAVVKGDDVLVSGTNVQFEVTLFYAYTHGEIPLWRASHTDELYYSGSPSEVSAYVNTKPGGGARDVPVYNLAVFHSCQTLNASGSNNQNPRSFGLLGTNDATLPNQAYAGFAAAVHYTLLKPQGQTLDEHAKRLFERLAAGERMEFALLQTQDDAHTQDPKWPHVPGSSSALYMIMRGDEFARIVNVYLNENEWNQYPEVRDSWYWRMP